MSTTREALEKLTKWRMVFAGWQLGTRAKGDPEADAVRDHRELTIVLRAEVSTLVTLCVEKGVFTYEEWDAALGAEAKALDADYEARFPGMHSSADGIEMSPRAQETMRGWRP